MQSSNITKIGQIIRFDFDNKLGQKFIQMFLQVKIEQQQFKVSVGKGFNDWVWLAHYASRIYSKTIYPQGIYIPTVLYIQNLHKQAHIEKYPHPRQKIFKYLDLQKLNPNEIRCVVKIRKANHSYSELQKKWERQAYEKEQYFITFNFSYILPVFSINRKRDFVYKIKTQYAMADEVKQIFNQKDYPSEVNTPLQEKQIDNTQSRFFAQLQLPLGTTSHKLYYLQRDSPMDEYTETQVSEKKIKKEDFIIREEPIYVSRHQITAMIEKDMKIDEDIGKTLQQKELQTKKRNASSSLCCYTFQQLWDIIEKLYGDQISLGEYEKSTIERIKLLIEKNIDGLYEIFFYYFILQNQQKDKKEELGVTYQDVMHFLRDYGVFTDLNILQDFFEFYNSDESKYARIEDTLDIVDHSIKFPQFIVILLRSIQFLQSSALIMKGETFDSASTKIFAIIVEFHAQMTDQTPFQLNLCENPKIISFIRTNSQKIKQIYTWMFKSSIESSSPICIGKEQVKLLLITFSLVENGMNIDKIMDECFRELRMNEKDIFYYDALIIFQWLSIALVKEEKDEDEQNFNEEEEAMMIVEKMKFFIGKITLN